MNCHERTFCAIRHQRPDRVPKGDLGDEFLFFHDIFRGPSDKSDKSDSSPSLTPPPMKSSQIIPVFFRSLIAAGLAIWVQPQALAAEGQPQPVTNLLQAKPEAVAAWKDMRFGMFICWGPVTLTGEEIGWSRGEPTPVEDYDNFVS
jgi:hypothetical protein